MRPAICSGAFFNNINNIFLDKLTFCVELGCQEIICLLRIAGVKASKQMSNMIRTEYEPFRQFMDLHCPGFHYTTF